MLLYKIYKYNKNTIAKRWLHFLDHTKPLLLNLKRTSWNSLVCLSSNIFHQSVYGIRVKAGNILRLYLTL